MSETRIEWTDATWNPVAGCSVLTTGRINCYAMAMLRASTVPPARRHPPMRATASIGLLRMPRSGLHAHRFPPKAPMIRTTPSCRVPAASSCEGPNRAPATFPSAS